MQGRFTRTDVEAARKDLKNRTLAHIGLKFGRLLYLASMRDYNTGHYYHDGLALQFSRETAGKALAEEHQEEFISLALGPLQDFANQLQLYLHSLAEEPKQVIRVWQKLEPYRVVIPIDSDPLIAALFLANVKIALAVVAMAESHRQAVH